MKLPLKPRILFIWEVQTQGYEYIFCRFPIAFLRIGCELSVLDLYKTTFETYKETIESFKPDLIFGLLRQPWAVCKVARFLQDYHPVVALNWFQEDPNLVNPELLEASQQFDFWFTQDPRTVPFWPTKAFFSPHAFDSMLYYDQSITRSIDVSYVGTLGHSLSEQMIWPYMEILSDYKRKAFFALERPMGLPLLPRPLEKLLRYRRLRSMWQKLPFWPCQWNNPRNEAEKALIVNKSKIHFCLSRVRGNWEDSVKILFPEYPLDENGLFCQTKGRLFHAVGAGAMALVDYVPELEDLFIVGKEVIAYQFNDYEDVRDKLKWYLKHDSERKKIAKAGYERGHREHTFEARIKTIFKTIRELA